MLEVVVVVFNVAVEVVMRVVVLVPFVDFFVDFVLVFFVDFFVDFLLVLFLDFIVGFVLAIIVLEKKIEMNGTKQSST